MPRSLCENQGFPAHLSSMPRQSPGGPLTSGGHFSPSQPYLQLWAGKEWCRDHCGLGGKENCSITNLPRSQHTELLVWTRLACLWKYKCSYLERTHHKQTTKEKVKYKLILKKAESYILKFAMTWMRLYFTDGQSEIRAREVVTGLTLFLLT